MNIYLLNLLKLTYFVTQIGQYHYNWIFNTYNVKQPLAGSAVHFQSQTNRSVVLITQ